MRTKVAIVFVSLAFVFLFFIFASTKNSSQLHFKLTEFYNQLSEDSTFFANRYVTLYGVVVEGSLERSGTSASFQIMEDNTTPLNVFFPGTKEVLPDTFQEGSQVSLEGVYQVQQQKFIANKIMAKCASKYENRI